MRDGKLIDLKYLNENEIVEFYELFFGKILLKKPDFSYHKNLSQSLSKENSTKIILERLNQNELDILKVLSGHVFVPNKFIEEKLQIILNIPTAIITKSLANLIIKKFIFLREEKILVIPDVYFEKEENFFNFIVSEDTPKREYSSRTFEDINNLINYFISKEIKFSNINAIYKKDAELLEETFSSYSNLKKHDYNVVSYFFAVSFLNSDETINIASIKSFFELLPLERILFFTKIVFPSVYAIIEYFYKMKKDISLKLEEFKTLWLESFLLTEYAFTPLKYNLNTILSFLKLTELINFEDDIITIKYYETNNTNIEDDVRVSSNFNLYLNANSVSKDFYFPCLFADFIKYNKIVEYEITESSVKRGVVAGIGISEVFDYFNKFGIQLSNNVETTLKHWFEKNGSFYFVSGTLFFCEGEEKGKIIKTLVKNDMIKVYEIKKNEVFLIPEEEMTNFFSVINKTGISYFKKDIIKEKILNEPKIYDMKKLLK
jgi:hypothetical protein